MKGFAKRIFRCIKTAITMSRAGVTRRSILLFPLRQRLSSQNRIDLKGGVSITAPVNEPLLTMFHEIWVDRCYAPGSLAVASGDAIVDLGANVGVFALWAATTYPGATVISLEPSPRMCTFLQRNIAASGVSNVMILQCACGGVRREAILYRRGPEAMNSLYSTDNYGSRFCPLVRTEVLTLGDVFARFGVSRCALLKLDCEGAEYEILFGAEDGTLGRVERIVMEYHVGLNEHTPDRLAGFLESSGFEVDVFRIRDEEGGHLHARRQR